MAIPPSFTIGVIMSWLTKKGIIRKKGTITHILAATAGILTEKGLEVVDALLTILNLLQ